MKVYRTDDRAPKWMTDARMSDFASVTNCPQCKGEIRFFRNEDGARIWRCTSCRIELEVERREGLILSARNLQPHHLGPPDILCSACGEVLRREAKCFRCQCGREVRA